MDTVKFLLSPSCENVDSEPIRLQFHDGDTIRQWSVIELVYTHANGSPAMLPMCIPISRQGRETANNLADVFGQIAQYINDILPSE